MKVLMIAPPSGGIDVYVQYLATELRRLGLDVTIKGSTEEDQAFDIVSRTWKSSEWVKERMNLLVDKIDFGQYDLVAFHFGKNDVEQYIPVILKQRKIKIKSLYFVHYLSRNLFSKYLKDPETREEVEKHVYTFFEGYIFYGSFSKAFFEQKTGVKYGGLISFLPETHSKIKLPKSDIDKLVDELTFLPKDIPYVYVLGYASSYKDPQIIIESLRFVDKPFKLIFAGRGWSKQIGFKTRIINKTHIFTIDREINTKEFKYISENSLFGIFPYRQPMKDDEVFQGSGVLPNFIFNGKANIVFDEGCLKENIGNAGIVLEKRDPRLLGKAIKSLLNDEERVKYERLAKQRSYLFSIEKHAKDCYNYMTKL